MANLTDRRPVKNTGTSLIVTHGYTFLPGQIITIPDHIWYGKEMWKVSNLKAEVKGTTLSEDTSNMLGYAIDKYLSMSTTTPVEVTKSGITYQGYIVRSDGDKTFNNPLIFFKEKAVTPISVNSISMSVGTQTLAVGGTTTATITFDPTTATNKEVTWSSSNDAVATVEETTTGATITAVASGTARITAVAADGNKKSYKDITVS